MSKELKAIEAQAKKEAGSSLKKIKPKIVQAKDLKVKTAGDAESANTILKDIRSFRKEFESAEAKIAGPAWTTYKACKELFREPIESAKEAEGIIKGKLTVFTQKERAIETKKRAAAEAAAEKKRKAIEEKAKASEKAGDYEEADKFAEQAASVTAKPVEEAKVPSGFHTRKVWKAVTTDKLTLIIAAAEQIQNEKPEEVSLQLHELLIVNEVKLGELAKSLKGRVIIPGIRFEEVETGVGR